MVSNVISQLAGVVAKLSAIVKIRKYKNFHEKPLYSGGHGDAQRIGVIWILSSGSMLVFSTINNQEVIYPCLFCIQFFR
jgi:hypothetical protein